LDALTAHICVLAVDGTILAVNESWRTFAAANLPLPANADVGANYLAVCEAVTGEDATAAQEVARGLRTVARGGLSEFSLEYPCHSPDTQRWFVLRATRFAGEGPVRIVVAHVNMTARKQAEESLREQAALLDAANDAIYVHDLDQKVLYWNRAAEQLSGWTTAEAVGHNVADLLKYERAVANAAHTTLLEQGSWSGELQQTTKAGKPLIVFSGWTLLRDEQGQPKKVLTINADLTKNKELEANFLRAQRLESVGALASGIAHDLNNILTPMLMIAPLLRDTVPDADSRAMLDTVESCAQRGADIIKQLLTFARGTPGTRVSMPIKHLLSDMNQIIRETFPRDIEPRVGAAKDLWLVLGDATQLHQALMNLCVNARDAMPDGGTLTVEAKNVTVDEAFAAMTPFAKPGLYVCVRVADTGTGIAPKDLDRIFDPFFTTKGVGKGTGLGLATVLGIVRGHEGFVRVDSQLRRGTTFELYFPASPQAQPPHLTGPKAPSQRGQGELILVVDDEVAVRDSLRRTLETHGYRVVTAAQGTEGLAAFSQHRAEVRAVLTDMMMPFMNGPVMIKALRALDPRLLILGMTGLPEQKSIKGLEDLDLPLMLTKPFTGDELLRVLRDALQRGAVTS
jgi:two-component system, cell cycle sensor histidine kinase and response regulator CckA